MIKVKKFIFQEITGLMNSIIKKIILGSGAFVSLFSGLPFLIFSTFGKMVEGYSRWPGIIFGIVGTSIGIFCIVKLIIIGNREKRINFLIALIGNQKSVPIQWLAEKKNTTVQNTINDLREAMSYGYFKDGIINEKENVLLFPNYNVSGATKTIICNNCGAGVEVMIGYYAKCPFCNKVLDTN